MLNEDGSQIGLFYIDFFSRDSKRGGAWMSSFVRQSGLLNHKPVIVNVLNNPKPADGKPALITFDNVTTMFHEMGPRRARAVFGRDLSVRCRDRDAS